MEKKNIGSEKALEKIKHFCSYQERTHQEVKDKLYSFGLHRAETESLLSQMIAENYLNEQRYALAFAGGKFRIKYWGRVKIKYELKRKRIGEYCINEALNSIEEEEYKKTLQKLLNTKEKTLKNERDGFLKQQKIRAYLLQKGYESALIADFMHKK